MDIMIENIVDVMKEADLILVGLGEELDLHNTIKMNKKYTEISEEKENAWILPFVEKLIIGEIKEEKCKIYNLLADCIKKKNYFVVSICQDGTIREAGLDEERIVEPCGGYRKLQCSEKCSSDLYDVPEELMEQIRMFMDEKKEKKLLVEPVCPVCGKPLVFNNVNAENYAEEGYLKQWDKYKKWLQGTVNRNVCILELGVGMKYPTVIRWPFEKITFFNNKAKLFRVHSRLYQITEEIKEKSYGICQKPEDFIRELSKAF